jgi:rhodanese-related sulfurtransferase
MLKSDFKKFFYIILINKVKYILIKRLKPEAIKKILNNKEKVRLIDVREEWENRIAKIDNSELIPLSNFIEASKKLNKDDTLIIYCHRGFRSAQVCFYLEKLGFSYLINLEGGIDAWSKQIDNSIPLY